MRYAAAFLILATPASAWDFQPGQPCRLTHATAEAEIALTYDPTGPLYSVTVRREEAWPDAPDFFMRFEGPQGRAIGTDRHVLSEDGKSLTVTDRSFGNVLDGLQFNHRAVASSGDAEAAFSLEGAAHAVAKFRACDGASLAS